MSFVSDTLGFEGFNLKDMWKKIKSHPQQLLTGVDPLSTKVWNGITGSHLEPVVDQMGGAYGGHPISAFGSKDGGVYKRAEEAGIDTKAGGQMQDAAHIIAAMFAGGYLKGQMPSFGGGQGGGGADWQQYVQQNGMSGLPGQQQQPTQQVDPMQAWKRWQQQEQQRKMLEQQKKLTGLFSLSNGGPPYG